ncbi:helix-turn-helix domain-containing protein [Mammaliicoccus fleurettii]|uniref:helix-turn-helix domain-containing protein n=1 Tax=Mammaliicoccus fleurettii TaxID=150056 RepID=UPI0009945051|nr:helix-turn-helix transcriptional regulator [Mammaliicoccus fleurettii]OOV78870.1 hypothetical protein B2G86_00660 [Mammaliicoccus fleurettii]
MDSNEVLSTNIKIYMVKTKKNITDLSKDTGIARSTLTPLIKGQSKMVKFETLDKITKALNVTVDQLFDFKYL